MSFDLVRDWDDACGFDDPVDLGDREVGDADVLDLPTHIRIRDGKREKKGWRAYLASFLEVDHDFPGIHE